MDRSEYVEQAYLFRQLNERFEMQMPIQELLEQAQHELLSTTRLPMAVSYLLTELKHTGLMAPAMVRISHYFCAFQAFLVAEAEHDEGRFGMQTALRALAAEADYRARGASAQGLFFFQFELLCRNRVRYDHGLTAMSSDPQYDADWARWILMLRSELGLVDIADLIFMRSEGYLKILEKAGKMDQAPPAVLFGEKEGRIAMGNRRKDPVLLFAAMQRHLDYPTVPRPKPVDRTNELIPQMQRRIERLESRIKLMEDERRGLDITRFYKGQLPPGITDE
ncbi:MAG: hypothetical protein AAFN70_07925 [Planctomycetota bacterium]